MVAPVSKQPFIGTPAALHSELVDHARAINQVVGTALPVPEYLKTELPDAATYRGHLIAVTNEAGGYTIAFSDGTDWRRVQDRAVVS